jgi:hypothetical protein
MAAKALCKKMWRAIQTARRNLDTIFKTGLLLCLIMTKARFVNLEFSAERDISSENKPIRKGFEPIIGIHFQFSAKNTIYIRFRRALIALQCPPIGSLSGKTGNAM